jgi:hypothetical protein
MANRLTDGLPITTEWLNTLVDEINSLKGVTVSPGSTSLSKKINVLGTNFTGDRTIQVVADTFTDIIPAGENVLDRTVQFQTPFYDNNVIVVVTPSFISTSNRVNRPFLSYASVGLITSSKFELSVSLTSDLADLSNGRSVVVNYIAIGKSL